MTQLVAVVMAAGHGTRMKSALPKVVHPACGRPLVFYPVRAALELGASRVVVVVNPETRPVIEAALTSHLPDAPLTYAVQQVPRGTGDAVRAGLEGVETANDDIVLVLSGDTPLLQASDLTPIVDAVRGGQVLSFLSFEPDDVHGYGRVLRDDAGNPTEIREHRDLRSDAERAVREANAGMYAARADSMRDALARLEPTNAQGEFYLTDIVRLLSGHGALSAHRTSPLSTLGVNHRGELADAEEILFARIRKHWAREGATIVGRPLIDDSVRLERDVVIEDGVRLRGKTSIGAETRVDVGTVIDDSSIGSKTHVKPYCVLNESVVGHGVQLGPFAHLRPGSIIDDEAHLGNFVETKNTRLRRGAKANHLAYLGEGDIGEGANLGAGTILCNYDGFKKSRTTVGARAFIGSDSQLVAPVTIGDDAYVATGTTVTRDVPAGALAIGRVRQENKEGYGLQLRERLRAQAAEAKKAAASDKK